MPIEPIAIASAAPHSRRKHANAAERIEERSLTTSCDQWRTNPPVFETATVALKLL
jgi:hypothetical protein